MNELILSLLIFAIIIVLFISFWIILKRRDNSISGIEQKIEVINDEILYNRTSFNKLLKLMDEMKKEMNSLKVEENSINIINKIDHLENYEKNTYLLVKNLQDLIVEINRRFSTLQSSPAFKEPMSALKEPISGIPQTHGVKSELSRAESNLIVDFNRMLVDSDYEKDFRTRHQQLAPAFCNSNGMISLIVTAADEENLWIIPRSDHDNAVVLPSRRLLTKFLSTLLSNKGEGASTLIGSCFDVVVCDDLERACLKRFAEAEIERNATGQIIKVRILKKGQLELPSGKG